MAGAELGAALPIVGGGPAFIGGAAATGGGFSSGTKFNELTDEQKKAALAAWAKHYGTSDPIYQQYKKQVDAVEADKQKTRMGPQRKNYGYGPIDVTKLGGYNALKNLATQQGPSQEAQYSLLQNLLNRQNTIDAANKSQAGAYGQAISQLGSQGGIGSGARERLSMQGAKNKMMGVQGAYRDTGTNLLDILKSDQANKTKALGDFSGLEQGYAKNNMDIVKDIYNQDIARWGAARQAGDDVPWMYDTGIGGASVDNQGNPVANANTPYNQGMFGPQQPQQGQPQQQGGPVGGKMSILPVGQKQPQQQGQYSIMNNLKSRSF